MTIREHKSQHDHEHSLPLISDSATVTDVEPVDRNPLSEVRKNILQLGRKHGFDEVIPDRCAIDWELVFDEATGVNRNLSLRIEVLRERFARAHPT